MKMELSSLTLSDLTPSQFCVSRSKLVAVERWFDPADLSRFSPIPVKYLDGRFVMTDGHTRAVAALRAGLERVPLVWDEDELDWDLYRLDVLACRARGVFSPADLASRVLSDADYAIRWDAWCDRLQNEVEVARKSGLRSLDAILPTLTCLGDSHEDPCE